MESNEFDWVKVMSEIPVEEILKAIHILERTGMFTDEDGFATFGAFRQKEALVDRLTKEGYNGGELITIGHFYPTHGKVLAIYDSNYFEDYESARRYLDEYVKKKDYGSRY